MSRVLLLPHSYPPVIGGVQLAVARLARGLREVGETVLVATRRVPPDLPRREHLDGVPVVRYKVPASGFSHRAGFLRQLPRRAGLAVSCAQIAALLRRHRPDVVNVHFPDKETLLTPTISLVRPTPLVVSFHGNELGRPGDPPSRLRLRALRRLLDSAHAVTACSQSLLDQVLDVAPEVAGRSRVVHNAVDLAPFSVQPPHPAIRPYVFAAGRMSHEKGFDLLIEAFAGSVQQFADLWIAGTGVEERALREQVSQSRLEGRIRFLGQRDPSDLPALIAGSELVVIPSRADAFPLLGLEAMAAGKRVLATRVGGLPEMVEDPPNRLVEPTVEGIARGLLACWSDSPEAVAATAERNRATARRFSPEVMVAGYLGAYADASSNSQ